MFKKFKSKLLNDLNYTNKFAYVSLTIFSVGCVVRSLFFATDSKWFVILSAIGCSGLVSVLVAALIEKSNNRVQKKRDKKIIEHLLFGYDIRVKTELQRALSHCDKNSEIDIDKEYTVMEIREMLDGFDSNNVYFKGFLLMLEKCLSNISADFLLSFENDDEGLRLHTMLEALQGYLGEMNRFSDENEMLDLLKLFTLLSYDMFNEINTIRKKDYKYTVHEDAKKYILAMRNAKNKLKEVK